jgi:small subunit ribosomal protein S1
MHKEKYIHKRPRRDDITMAPILSIGDHDIFVELDGKRDGKIQKRDLDEVDVAYRSQLSVGDSIPVRIIKVPNNNSAIIVSLKQGLEQQDWIEAKKLQEKKEVIEVVVKDVNRGGAIAYYGQIRGFIPNSHLVSVTRGLRDKDRREKKRALIGELIPVVVIEVKPRLRQLILSERLAQNKKRESIIEELKEGMIRSGTVINLKPYGAFVDLGGIDGLIHISETSWDYVKHPREVLNVGDEVEVYVLKIDRKRKRIALSRKRALLTPWEESMKSLEIGDLLEGIVKGAASFGAFVEVGNGVEGLIPASDFQNSRAELDTLSKGMRVNVEILDIDRLKERVVLHLKRIY